MLSDNCVPTCSHPVLSNLRGKIGIYSFQIDVCLSFCRTFRARYYVVILSWGDAPGLEFGHFIET